MRVMEVKDLRIGNYLDYYGQPCIVLEIKRNQYIECGYFNDSIGFERKLTEKHSPKPIPLSEQWLLDFGFEYKEAKLGCRGIYSNGKINVNLSNNGNVYTSRGQLIPYVHIFQNWYYYQNLRETDLILHKQ